MSDVFEAVFAASHPTLRACALGAAADVGLWDAVAQAPRAPEALAEALALSPHRLRALCDVLCAEGALRRVEGGAVALALNPHTQTLAARPHYGWGLLGRALRTGEPVADEAALEGEALRRYHAHLAEVGAEPARLLAEGWLRGARRVLDAGGGAGIYARAALDANPDAEVVVLDRPEVLRAVQGVVELPSARAAWAGADLCADPLPEGPFDSVLLANVLHLYGPEACAALVARLARVLGPGGLLVVKELGVDDARSAPLWALYFALNMALYTREGDVHTPRQMIAWLAQAGLCEVRAERLTARDGAAWVISGRAQGAARQDAV